MAAVLISSALLRENNYIIDFDQGLSFSHPQQRGQLESPQRVPSANVGLAAAGSGGAGMSARQAFLVTRHETVDQMARVADGHGGARRQQVMFRGQGDVGVHCGSVSTKGNERRASVLRLSSPGLVFNVSRLIGFD